MEFSYFWNTTSVGDGIPATRGILFPLWKALFGEGVLEVPGTGEGLLVVSGTTATLSVTSGWAIVGGCFYHNSAAASLTLDAPQNSPRADTIALVGQVGAGDTVQNVRLTVLKNPQEILAPPDPTQSVTWPGDSAYWGIPLAHATITVAGAVTVTDARIFARSALMISTANIMVNAILTGHILDAQVTYAKLAADAKAAASVQQQGTQKPTGAQDTTTSWVDFITKTLTIAASPIHPSLGGHIFIQCNIPFVEKNVGSGGLMAQLLVDGVVVDSASFFDEKWTAMIGQVVLVWAGDIGIGAPTKIIKVQIKHSTGGIAPDTTVTCGAESKMCYQLFS
jgi:hypothetical protein